MLVFIKGAEDINGSINLLQKIAAPENMLISSVAIDDISTITIPNTASVHFATDDILKYPSYITELALRTIHVFNARGLLTWSGKVGAQQRLSQNHILVPRIIWAGNKTDFNEAIFKNISTDFYIKSEIHMEPVQQITHETIQNTADAINILQSSNFYLEESVRGIETKVYWIIDKAFVRNETETSTEIQRVMGEIHQALDLDFFSADFISNDSGHYCIDINPGTSGYGSPDGLVHLVRRTKKLFYQ